MVRKWVFNCTLIALSRKKGKLRRQGDGERRREEERVRGREGEKRRREGERCREEGGRVRRGYTHYHERVDGMVLKMTKDYTFVDEGAARSHFVSISTFSQEIGTSFASVSKPKLTPTPTTFIHPLPHHLHPSSPPLTPPPFIPSPTTSTLHPLL